MTAAKFAGSKRHRIHLDIPDSLYQWLSGETKQRGVTIDQVLYEALDLYAQTESTSFDITQTQTWELCGALTVAETEPEYVVAHDETGEAVTNYAEHVDDVLYRDQ